MNDASGTALRPDISLGVRHLLGSPASLLRNSSFLASWILFLRNVGHVLVFVLESKGTRKWPSNYEENGINVQCSEHLKRWDGAY